MRLSRRTVIERLKASRIEQPLEDSAAENLAARLKSLAVSGSQLEDAHRGRVGRKALAVVGSIGIFTWIGVTGVAASVGLVATGNMPAPIQNAVSSVLEVAGIQVPRADEDTAPAGFEQPDGGEFNQELEITTTTLADQSSVETEDVLTSVPIEKTVPYKEDDAKEETPTTIARPVANKPTTSPNKGQEGPDSGNANSGNSGNANSGNSGNANNGNSGAGSEQSNAGNQGNAGRAGNVNSGNSGQGNNGQGNGNSATSSETVITAPAVLAPLMPVNEPAKGNSNNQGNNSNQNKGKGK